MGRVDVCWALTGALRQDIYQISASRHIDYIDFLVWTSYQEFKKILFCLLSIYKTVFKIIYFNNVWSLLILLPYILPILSYPCTTLKNWIIKVKHSHNLIKDRLTFEGLLKKPYNLVQKPITFSFFFFAYHKNFTRIECREHTENILFSCNRAYLLQNFFFLHSSQVMCYFWHFKTIKLAATSKGLTVFFP